jgi:DNA uptake protein ComE-like DNA-binding protein
MNQRFATMSRNQKIGAGLVALLLSCGICSRLGGGNKPATTDKPTDAAATEVPVKVEVTATDEPVATATEAATATADSTATEEPTAELATATPVQPTAQPAYMSLDPGQDRDCDEFPSQAAAQSYWESYRTAERPNPGRLDGNGNSKVCEDPDRAARQAPAQEQAAPPPAASASGCVNFNTAGYDDLRRIKYVEDKIAQEILSKRPFSGWDDLVDKVSGIGDKNVKEIQAEGIGCF